MPKRRGKYERLRQAIEDDADYRLVLRMPASLAKAVLETAIKNGFSPIESLNNKLCYFIKRGIELEKDNEQKSKN